MGRGSDGKGKGAVEPTLPHTAASTKVGAVQANGWLKAPPCSMLETAPLRPRFQALVSTGSLHPYTKDSTRSHKKGAAKDPPTTIEDDVDAAPRFSWTAPVRYPRLILLKRCKLGNDGSS